MVMNRHFSELSVLITPRRVDPTRRAVIYAHGASGNGSQVVDGASQKGITRIFGTLAHAGFVVMSADWGGPQTYGNDAELAAMEAGWNWLKASGLCATDKVILSGASMGMLSISRFAAEHPSESAAIASWIPAIDVENLRITNALSLRNFINTAWGLSADSTSISTSPAASTVPTRGRPLDRLAEVQHIPTKLWHSSGDTATLSSAVTAYAAGRPGVQAHLVSTTLQHSDAAIMAASVPDAVSFMESVAHG